MKSVNQYIYEDDENSLNVLHLAAGLDSEHREEVIELLIDLKADLNCPGKSENVGDIRALHLSAMWGYDMTVKLLLYHGADASLRDTSGLSSIDYASIFDNYLCISILLRYGSLNSTASAWSAIMDSSYGESNADSSFEHFLDIASPDAGPNNGFGGDRARNTTMDQSNFFDIGQDEDDYDPWDEIKDEDLDLRMANDRLRLELRRLGHCPGPITGTTKKLYAKLLVHLTKEDKELVYSPRTKTKSQTNGLSVQLNSIITGKFSTKQALDLEREFIQVSNAKDYHGPKQFFNYILIDPRISKNLPEQALEASDSDTSRGQTSPEGRMKQDIVKVNRKFNSKLFTIFLESIFYIGKGQKKRDLMHLYDALADRDSITQNKIDRIRSIWEDGFGVVSLHLFHNITSKEALTREALMIDAIGLQNLTNLLKGTLQFKLNWNEHRRKLLGALFLHRAYNQLLNEGERQLKKEDLKMDK